MIWRTVLHLIDEIIPLDHPQRFASQVIRWYDLIQYVKRARSSYYYTCNVYVSIPALCLPLCSTYIRWYPFKCVRGSWWSGFIYVSFALVAVKRRDLWVWNYLVILLIQNVLRSFSDAKFCVNKTLTKSLCRSLSSDRRDAYHILTTNVLRRRRQRSAVYWCSVANFKHRKYVNSIIILAKNLEFRLFDKIFLVT